MPRPTQARAAWLSFAIVTGFFLFEFIARIEPSLATAEIGAWFGLSKGSFSTLSSLFFWVYAPMQLVVGLLLDRYGARRLVVPAVAVCASGVMLFAATDTPAVGAIGRVLTGLGAAFAFVGSLYVANHRFAPERFALMSGLVSAVGMLGTAVGAVLLSAAIDTLGWRPVFLASAGMGALVFALALIWLDDGTDGARPVAPRHPLAPLGPLMREGRVWLIAVLGALYYMPVNVYGGLWGKAQIMADRGFDGTQAELAVSALFWGLAAGSVGAGALSDRLGHRKYILFAGAVLCTLSFAAAIYAPLPHLWMLAALLFLSGLFGGPQMLTFAMAKEGHPAAISGTVIAVVNMIGIGGALVFQPLVGALIDVAGGAFGPAMLSVPACLSLAALMTLMLRERRHSDHITAPKAP